LRIITLLSLKLLVCISFANAQQTGEGILTDIDHNIYHTVHLGKYIWIAENLKTTRYNNGTQIQFVEGNSKWPTITTPAFCWYDDDQNNSYTYGALYNWYAVNSGNLCPTGWRVPSDDEWKYLEGYTDSLYKINDPVWNKSGIRGYNAGKRLKAKSGWRLNYRGTDEFGFSALPGGERLNSFNNTKTSSGFWWTSSEADSDNAWYRCMIYSLNEISRDIHPKRMGFSVRCIKNEKELF